MMCERSDGCGGSSLCSSSVQALIVSGSLEAGRCGLERGGRERRVRRDERSGRSCLFISLGGFVESRKLGRL